MLLPNRNPLIYREWCHLTRPGRLAGWLIAVLGLLALGYLFISLQNYSPRTGYDYAEVFRQFGIFVIVVKLFLAFYVALGIAIDSVVMEKIRNAYEFLVTLPISCSDKVVGLSLGPTLLPLLIALMLVPVGLFFGAAGGLFVGKLIWVYVIMLAGYAAFVLTGLVLSTGFGRQRGWGVVLGMFVLGMILMGLVRGSEFPAVPLTTFSPYGILWASVDDSGDNADVFTRAYHFFSLGVPWQVCPLVFYVFLAGVSFVVAARRLSRPQGRALPRWAVLAIFILLHFLLVGFLADSFLLVLDGCENVAGAYLMSFFWGILLWGMFALPRYARLMEWVEERRYRFVRLLTGSFTDPRTPAFLPAGLLWVLVVVTVVCIDAIYWGALEIPALLLFSAVWLVFIMAYLTLSSLGCMSARRGGRVVGVVYVVLVIAGPLIFANVEGLEGLTNATPFGLLEHNEILIETGLALDWSIHDPLVQSFLWGLGQLVLYGLLVGWQLRGVLAVSPRGKQSQRGQGGRTA